MLLFKCAGRPLADHVEELVTFETFRKRCFRIASRMPRPARLYNMRNRELREICTMR